MNQHTLAALAERLLQAANAHDADALVECFSENAIVDAAIGPDAHGTRIVGKPAIRESFAENFRQVQSLRYESLRTYFADDRIICEQRRTATLKSGESSDIKMIDIVTVENGLVVRKDTYYKVRTPSHD